MTNEKLTPTKEEYEQALLDIEDVFDAEPGTPEADKAKLLGSIIFAYEEEHYPIHQLSEEDENIKTLWINSGMHPRFIYTSLNIAEINSGVRGLIKLWFEETDEEERDEIIADIAEFTVDDAFKSAPLEQIDCNEIKALYEKNTEYKKGLRERGLDADKLYELIPYFPLQYWKRFINSVSLTPPIIAKYIDDALE